MEGISRFGVLCTGTRRCLEQRSLQALFEFVRLRGSEVQRFRHGPRARKRLVGSVGFVRFVAVDLQGSSGSSVVTFIAVRLSGWSV
jgi:hypothetical protein